jgi:hypothetical protein
MNFDINTIKSWNEKSEKNTDFWRPQQGENLVRIIEAPKDSELPSMYVAYKHFNVGPEKRSYWCRKSTGSKDRDWNSKCPVCDYVSQLYDTGEEEDRKFASSMKASQRILLNVVDLNNAEEGVKLFECSKTLWDIMIRYWGSSKWGNLADAEAGYNFIIERDGPKNFPNYDKSRAEDDSTPIQNKAWIKDIKDLSAVTEIKSFEALKSILETGEDIDESSEAPKKEAPSISTDSTPPWEESTPEPKAEETPTPKAKKKSKKPPCFGDDETYDATDEDCQDCKWEEMCEAKCIEIGSNEEDGMDDLEKEIMRELKG